MMKKLVLLCVAFVAVLSTLILSGVLTMSAEEVTEYSITVAENDAENVAIFNYTTFTSCDVPCQASPGDMIGIYAEYSDKVFVGAYINGTYYEGDYVYFDMPKENVEIQLVADEGHSITVLDSDASYGIYFDYGDNNFYEYETCAYLGDDMILSAHYDNKFLVGAYINGTYYESEGSSVYFTMPGEDVIIELVTEEGHCITILGDDRNSCIYNESYGTGDSYKNTYVAPAGAELKFELVTEYSNNFLVGAYIDGVYIESDGCYLYFTMPDKDITIELVTTTEGYSITVAENNAEYVGIYNISYNVTIYRTDYRDGDTLVAPAGSNITLWAEYADKFFVGAYVNGTYYEYEDYCVCFTMPEENVEIQLVTDAGHTITVLENGAESVEIYDYTYDKYWVSTAVAGSELALEANYSDKFFIGAYINGEKVEAFSDYGDSGYMYFTMPDGDVTIELIFKTAYSFEFEGEFADSVGSIYINGERDDGPLYDRAAEGDEIEFYYDIDDYAIVGLSINGGEAIPIDWYDKNPSFIMPAEDAVISFVVEKKHSITSPDYPDLRVSYESANGEWYVCSSAPEGTKIKIGTRSSAEHRIVGAYINGTKYSVDDNRYIYFTMPAEDVEIEFIFIEKHSITVVGEDSEHIYLSHNGAFAGTEVRIAYVDTSSFLTGIIIDGETISANESGTVDFTMPDHDVVITLIAADKYAFNINLENANSVVLDYATEFFCTINPLNPLKTQDIVSAGVNVCLMCPVIYNGESAISHVFVNGQEITPIRLTSEVWDPVTKEFIQVHTRTVYEFVMPAEDVEVVLVSDFYKLTPLHADKSVSCMVEIEEGRWQSTTLVKEGDVVRIHSYGEFALVGAYINGEKSVAGAYGEVKFTMPAEDVEIEAITARVYDITFTGDYADDCNAYIVYGEDENWVSDAPAGATVNLRCFLGSYNHFYAKGFNVNGVYHETDEDGNCFITMPEEAITVEPVLAEKFYIDIEDSLENYEGILWWVDERYLAPGQTVELHYELSAGIVGFTVNGEVVDFTIVENEYYGITATFKMPAEDILIDALYDDTQYTITVDSDHGVYAPSSALANERVEIAFEHVPGYVISSITINGFDLAEFNGDYRTDIFTMPAENVVIKVTYEENGEEYEEVSFEAEIELPGENFGGDYRPEITLPESVITATPEEFRDNLVDFVVVGWYTSDGAFPALTFDSIEDFITVYAMEYDSVFSEDYNHGAMIAIPTSKNYAFAKSTIIINGKEVPATLLSVDMGDDTYYGTFIFFEFELEEYDEEEVDFEVVVDNLPSVGESFYEYVEDGEYGGYYESAVDFELPIDGNYQIEDVVWLHTDSEFPNISSTNDLYDLLYNHALDYDAIITSEGKYAVLLAVTVDYGTNLKDGSAIFNEKLVTIKIISPEDISTYSSSGGNIVYILIEFEVSDEGDMVPAEILGDAPSDEDDENNSGNDQDNTHNPETGDRNYTSMFISVLMAVILLGAFVIVMSVKKSKRNRA